MSSEAKHSSRRGSAGSTIFGEPAGLSDAAHSPTWRSEPLRSRWSVIDCKHVTARFVDSGFPIASIGEVQSTLVDLRKAHHTTINFYRRLTEGGRTPQSGDLILSRNATVGEVAQVTDEHPPFAMGQDVCLLRKRSVDSSTGFLQQVIRSDVVKRQLDNLMVGSTFRRVNVRQVESLAIPWPDPSEQKTIAAALSDVDGLIASLDRLIAKKRAIKQAAMQQLLTGKTRLPGFSGKWDAKPLRALADITMGQSPASVFYNVRGDGLPLIQGNADIEDRRSIARVWTTQSSKRCIAGDILLTVRAPVGAVGVASESACLGRGVCGLRPLADSSFLLQALVFAEPCWKILEQGSTFTSANRIQVGQFELRVPLDPSEQHAIAVVLDDMDADLRSLEVRAAKAKAIKQGMMQALLTGRVRLPVETATSGSEA